MTPLEALDLLTDVQRDYAAMVRELNKHKRLVHPVDPWTLPLMERMTKARRDLALAGGLSVEEAMRRSPYRPTKRLQQ